MHGPTIQNEILSIVRDYAIEQRRVVPAFGATLNGDSDLTDFGLDSVDMVCVAARIEDRFGVTMEPTLLLRFDTINQAIPSLLRALVRVSEKPDTVPATVQN